MDITIQEKRITLVNIYGSNTDSPEIYSKFIQQIENIANDNRVIGGYHNFVLNVNKHKREGNPVTNTNTQELVQAWMEESDLVDIWRMKNPDTFRSTWRRKNPTPIQCRHDFFLISFGLTGFV